MSDNTGKELPEEYREIVGNSVLAMVDNAHKIIWASEMLGVEKSVFSIDMGDYKIYIEKKGHGRCERCDEKRRS